MFAGKCLQPPPLSLCIQNKMLRLCLGCHLTRSLSPILQFLSTYRRGGGGATSQGIVRHPRYPRQKSKSRNFICFSQKISLIYLYAPYPPIKNLRYASAYRIFFRTCALLNKLFDSANRICSGNKNFLTAHYAKFIACYSQKL